MGRCLHSLILLTLMTVPYSYAYGWFEEFRQSVRGKSMNNALGSTFEGVEAMYYNPASLAHLESFEFMTGFARPAGGFTSFDDGSSISQFDVSLAVPFTNPVNLRTAGWENDFITTDAGFGLSFIQQGYDSGDGTAGLTQRYVGVTYAKNLDNLLFQGARLSAGITANIYMLAFTGTDVSNNAAFSNTNSTAFSPDIGVNYNFSDFILVSLVMENLIPASVSPFEDGESLTPVTRLGLSWLLGDIGKLPFLQDILITGEWRITSAPDQGPDSSANIASSSSYHAGWESWYKIPGAIDIATRAGMGVGDQSFSEATAGLGFSRYFDAAEKYRFDLNFAWTWSSFASSLGSDHRYYFGGVFKYRFAAGQLPGRRTGIEVEESLEVPESESEKVKFENKTEKEGKKE